jgi:hypothetical protein
MHPLVTVKRAPLKGQFHVSDNFRQASASSMDVNALSLQGAIANPQDRNAPIVQRAALLTSIV